MRTLKVIAITLAAASLSGCGVLKRYKRPAGVTAEGIYGDAQSGDSLGTGDTPWREIFTDPALQALITRALEQNTDMRNTCLQLEEMQYALKASKFAFLPTADFSPSGSIAKTYDPYGRERTRAVTRSYNKSYGLGLTAGWIDDNFLKLINAKRGAKVNVEQLENAKRAVQAALVANVATMYYTLAQLDEQLSLATQTRDNWGVYLDKQRKLMDAGQANLAAVANIEATYYNISQSVVSLANETRVLENNLCTLLGETGSHIQRGALSTFRAPRVVTTGAPCRILERRPDVKAAELTLARQFYKVNEAKADFFPSLTLSATGQFTNAAGAGLVNPGLFVTNYLLGLSQPLFKGGLLKATLGVQQKKLEEAQNDFKQQIIAAGNEVNTAMLDVRKAQDLKDLIDKEVSAQEKAYDATQKLYAATSLNYLNVITAHNSLLQARMGQISNRMDAITATIDLYQALGGGAD